MSEPKKLSPYWQKLANAADEILQERIERLQKKTVDPEYCLMDDDKARMMRQQWDIEGMQQMQKDVRKGGLIGKITAFETVLSSKPSLVFRKN